MHIPLQWPCLHFGQLGTLHMPLGRGGAESSLFLLIVGRKYEKATGNVSISSAVKLSDGIASRTCLVTVMVCDVFDEPDDRTDAACFCFVEFDIGSSIRLCRGVTPSPTVEGGGVDEVDRTRFILAFVWESRNAEYLPSLLSSLSLKLGVSFLLDRPDGAAFALEAVLVALLSVAGKGAGAGPVTESAVVELTDRDGAAFAVEAVLVALLPGKGPGPVTEAGG
mmetsp:Transcript_2756/g.6361  ORF Transcript_2756/g.6361 Transcript_2756/m.6361 type:complete len:223 (-) Transcript_2756:628-1296(-)